MLKLVQNDIACYAMHTNYDVLRMGDLASSLFQKGPYQLLDEEVLDVTYEETNGIGCIGNLENPIAIEACCQWLKECFGLPSLKVFGDSQRLIQRVAISPGSGKSMVEIAIQKGADLLITGDIGHHDGIDALGDKLTIIDASHYGMEHIFVDDMATFFEEKFPEIECIKAVYQFPFQVI